ncbi:MAG: hypothetical protein P4L84_27505 [Isosphaeraceae bacterium]|nr:hypothetical protein [Isosphaeraceae bacterium]
MMKWGPRATIVLGSLAFAGLGLGWAELGTAQAGRDRTPAPAMALHGGVSARAARHDFEVVFSQAGVKVYAYAADHKPIDTSRLTGTVTFYHPNTPEPWFSRTLHTAATVAGHAPDSLVVNINLSAVPTSGARVAFHVEGLADLAEGIAEFALPFAIALPPAISVAPITQGDERAVAAQKQCAVSGDELGSMGPPLKVSRGDRSTFLCCKACLKQIQANPDKYLAAPTPPAPAPAAALTYSKATAADQRAINAQHVCPVSGQSLGSMGGPIKVARGGQSVLLCCRSCLRALQANPDRYLGTAPSATDGKQGAQR